MKNLNENLGFIPLNRNPNEIAKLIFSLKEGNYIWFSTDNRTGHQRSYVCIEKTVEDKEYVYKLKSNSYENKYLETDEEITEFSKELSKDNDLHYYAIDQIQGYKKHPYEPEDDDQALGSYEVNGPDRPEPQFENMIKKSQLKSLIKNIIKESLLIENIQDPSKEEMLEFLRSQYGKEDGFEDDAEIAMYWFANFHHGGQNSNLYSVLSTSRFNPGRSSNGPQKESIEEMMYEDLVLKFAPESEDAREIKIKHNSFNEKIEPVIQKTPNQNHEFDAGRNSVMKAVNVGESSGGDNKKIYKDTKGHCATCQGSGEGQHEGEKCPVCRGTGKSNSKIKLTKRTDPDYEWDKEDNFSESKNLKRKIKEISLFNRSKKPNNEINMEMVKGIVDNALRQSGNDKIKAISMLTRIANHPDNKLKDNYVTAIHYIKQGKNFGNHRDVEREIDFKNEKVGPDGRYLDDMESGMKSNKMMGMSENLSNQKSYRFIYVGMGSGNVYGVSNATTIEKAWDEFKKNTVRTGEDASDAEYDRANVREKADGYWVIIHNQSEEGTFIILDIQSKNPVVQREINTLGLIKHADEYLKYKSAHDENNPLKEESGTGDVGGYSTPFAFSRNKLGSNRAIQAAKKYGKVVKSISEKQK